MKRFGTLRMAASWTTVGPLFGAGTPDPNGGKLKASAGKRGRKIYWEISGREPRENDSPSIQRSPIERGSSDNKS